jgi:ABC-type multidrug transport system fused ATPase/permease subunit
MAMVAAGWEFNMQFFMNSTVAGILYYSSILIEKGELTIGDVMSIMLYLIQCVMKFGEISWLIGEIFKVKGASMKILTMMQEQPQVNSTGGKIIPEKQIVGEIEFKNVSFNYPTKKDVMVTKNLSFHVKDH